MGHHSVEIAEAQKAFLVDFDLTCSTLALLGGNERYGTAKGETKV